MRTARAAIFAVTVSARLAAANAASADPPQSAPLRVSELPETYELVDRVFGNGKILRRPDIAALYTFGHASPGRVGDHEVRPQRFYRGH
jgi:hypothetical protein